MPCWVKRLSDLKKSIFKGGVMGPSGLQAYASLAGEGAKRSIADYERDMADAVGRSSKASASKKVRRKRIQASKRKNRR